MTTATVEQAIEQRDSAMQAVDAAADKNWKEEALATVKSLAQTQKEFSADNVWEAGLTPTTEPRALGPVLRRAVNLGYIRGTERITRSARRHMAIQIIWESLICQA
jgi:hypothetical protein